MPELNTEVPMFLQKRQESFLPRERNTAAIVMRGFELGMRQQEQALAERNALMKFQKDQFEKERYLLDTEEKMMEMDDLRTIRKAQQEYMHGNPKVAPPLVTYNGNRVWNAWKSSQELEIRQNTELNTFNEQVSKLDGFGIASVRSVGDWMKDGIQPAHYQKLGLEQTRVRDEALKAKYGTEVIEVDGQKYIRNRSTGALHAVPKDWSEGAPAVPIVDDDGNVLGYGLQNSRGGITQLRQPGTKRHFLQNKLDGLKSEMAGEEAAKHTLKAKQLQAEIAALEKTIAAEQAPSQSVRPNTPSVGDVLRYDPATRTFK
jgi:hypothetical protein